MTVDQVKLAALLETAANHMTAAVTATRQLRAALLTEDESALECASRDLFEHSEIADAAFNDVARILTMRREAERLALRAPFEGLFGGGPVQ